jgi:hypothetical protein
MSDLLPMIPIPQIKLTVTEISHRPQLREYKHGRKETLPQAVQKSTPKKIKTRNPQKSRATTTSVAAVKNQTLSNKNSKMSAILKNT